MGGSRQRGVVPQPCLERGALERSPCHAATSTWRARTNQHPAGQVAADDDHDLRGHHRRRTLRVRRRRRRHDQERRPLSPSSLHASAQTPRNRCLARRTPPRVAKRLLPTRRRGRCEPTCPSANVGCWQMYHSQLVWKYTDRSGAL